MHLFRRRAGGDHAPSGGGVSAAALPPSAVLPSCVPGARPELAGLLLPSSQQQCDSTQQLPIVYHPSYNITLFGIEKLHPFDSCKFSKVVKGLQQHGIISSTRQLVRPEAVSYETLGQVHAQGYLHHLQTSSLKVAQVRRSRSKQPACCCVNPTPAISRWRALPTESTQVRPVFARCSAAVHTHTLPHSGDRAGPPGNVARLPCRQPSAAAHAADGGGHTAGSRTRSDPGVGYQPGWRDAPRPSC